MALIIGYLNITFAHESEHNSPQDLGVEKIETITANGQIIRGLGTHFKSAESQELVKERQSEDARIRKAFRERFLTAPIPGCYVLNVNGDGIRLLDELYIRDDVKARVYEFDIAAEVPPDVSEWADRIKAQLGRVPTGRAKEMSKYGLDVLERLTLCPVLGAETKDALRQLIAGSKLGTIDRLEVQRQLGGLDVKIDVGSLQPARTTPTAVLPAGTFGPIIRPRQATPVL